MARHILKKHVSRPFSRGPEPLRTAFGMGLPLYYAADMI